MKRNKSRNMLLCAIAALCATPAFAAPPYAPPEHAWDARRDLPLLSMMAEHQKRTMREHLQAVSEIVAALAADDFTAIEKSAAHLGFSEEMGQMCENFGRAAPGFTDQALAFHHTADHIGVAAHAHDRAQILSALSETLEACTQCHATWKQRVVDEATWNQLTINAKYKPTGRD